MLESVWYCFMALLYNWYYEYASICTQQVLEDFLSI